jgi:hypothetical protein
MRSDPTDDDLTVPVADEGRVPVSKVRTKLEEIENVINSHESGGFAKWKLQEKVNELEDLINRYE